MWQLKVTNERLKNLNLLQNTKEIKILHILINYLKPQKSNLTLFEQSMHKLNRIYFNMVIFSFNILQKQRMKFQSV